MEISKQLQEQLTKAEDLFMEALSAQRWFIHMAGEEGFSEGDVEERWFEIARWRSKERNAELWKASVLGDDDESIDEVVESLDKLDLELMTYMEPEDELEQTRNLMVEYDRQLKGMVNAYAVHCSKNGMSNREIIEAVAKILGRELPMPEEEDPFADETLE